LCQCAQPRGGAGEGAKNIAKETVKEGVLMLTRNINR